MEKTMDRKTDLLTLEEVQSMLPKGAVTLQTLRNECFRGNLPAVKLGRRWIVSRKRLEELLDGEEAGNDR